MIVAMIPMHMVQVTIYQKVDMSAVRNLFVSAIRAMFVVRFMALARMLRGTTVRVLASNFDYNTVVVTVVTHMHVTIVQVCGVASVLHGLVPAIGTVNVSVFLMTMMTLHFKPP